MKVLVEDLLLLARLDETRPVERAPVDLAVLAADACSDAVAADPGRPVTLDAPEPVVVLGDQDHLRQAIANLVTNAARATRRRHARSRSAARQRRPRPRSSSATTAPGLDADALEHVFDRFWQADRARVGRRLRARAWPSSPPSPQEHGGDIAVANADGGGARFELTLPPP